MPHPPIQRGMRMVEEALKAAGHELLDFYLPDTAQADKLTVYPPPRKTKNRDEFTAQTGERIFPIPALYQANLLSPTSKA